MGIIQMHNLHYKVGKKAILKGISDEIQLGKVTGIIGPNGAGKSTLLRLLAGLSFPTTGSIRFGEKELHRWNSMSLAKRRGMLEQRSSAAMDLIVKDVIAMGRYPYHGMGDAVYNSEAIDQAMAFVGVEGFQLRSFSTLSGGEQQRVHLARILAQLWSPVGFDGKVLLLDEPLNNLDIHYQFTILEFARKFAKQGGAVIAVLHDLNLALAHTDKTILLDQGRKVVSGATEAVIHPEWLQPVFQISCQLYEPLEGSSYLQFGIPIQKTNTTL